MQTALSKSSTLRLQIGLPLKSLPLRKVYLSSLSYVMCMALTLVYYNLNTLGVQLFLMLAVEVYAAWVLHKGINDLY